MKKITQSYWKTHKGMPIWKQKNDDKKLGKEINFEQTKGKRLIGHSSDEDYYEDVKGETFVYKGPKGAVIRTDKGLTIKGTKVFD